MSWGRKEYNAGDTHYGEWSVNVGESNYWEKVASFLLPNSKASPNFDWTSLERADVKYLCSNLGVDDYQAEHGIAQFDVLRRVTGKRGCNLLQSFLYIEYVEHWEFTMEHSLFTTSNRRGQSAKFPMIFSFHGGEMKLECFKNARFKRGYEHLEK